MSNPYRDPADVERDEEYEKPVYVEVGWTSDLHLILRLKDVEDDATFYLSIQEAEWLREQLTRVILHLKPE